MTGLRVVVTGATGGIGSTSVAALRARGAKVAGIDLLGGDDLVQGDVTDRASITAAVEECAGALGGIDVLVNNAGIGRAQDAGDFPDAAAHAVMEVNFFGAWNATAAAMPHLLASRGHVVNVASGLAIVDVPFAAAYAASKRALVAYSAALRIEYRGRVGVTTVYPGYIRTSIHDAAAANGARSKAWCEPTPSRARPRRSCEPARRGRGRLRRAACRRSSYGRQGDSRRPRRRRSRAG